MLSLLEKSDDPDEAARLKDLVLEEEIFLTEGPKESLMFSYLKQYETDLKANASELPKGELLSLYGMYYQIFAYYCLVGSDYKLKIKDTELASTKCAEILSELKCQLG